MADLLLTRAHYNGNGLEWCFVDESMRCCRVRLDEAPTAVTIGEGDEWQVELVEMIGAKKRDRVATVRLVARRRKQKDWEKIKELPDFWMPESDLRQLLILLNEGVSVMLIGPKGTGKTSVGYKVAEALGWQEPYKVDVYTIRKTTDLFGSNGAGDGTSRFVASGFYNYVCRAITARREGLDAQFLVILDELNRVHAQSNESLHGLFDDTRQVSFITTVGTVTVKLPDNMHIVGTMNEGAGYLGAHGVDLALKDRFAAMRLKEMPEDYEVKKLIREIGIIETQAQAIVRVARNLRTAERNNQVSFSPSYRGCRNAAQLVAHGVSLKEAIVQGLMGWYDGDIEMKAGQFVAISPNSEAAKALAALNAKVGDSIL